MRSSNSNQSVSILDSLAITGYRPVSAKPRPVLARPGSAQKLGTVAAYAPPPELPPQHQVQDQALSRSPPPSLSSSLTAPMADPPLSLLSTFVGEDPLAKSRSGPVDLTIHGITKIMGDRQQDTLLAPTRRAESALPPPLHSGTALPLSTHLPIHLPTRASPTTPSAGYTQHTLSSVQPMVNYNTARMRSHFASLATSTPAFGFANLHKREPPVPAPFPPQFAAPVITASHPKSSAPAIRTSVVMNSNPIGTPSLAVIQSNDHPVPTLRMRPLSASASFASLHDWVSATSTDANTLPNRDYTVASAAKVRPPVRPSSASVRQTSHSPPLRTPTDVNLDAVPMGVKAIQRILAAYRLRLPIPATATAVLEPFRSDVIVTQVALAEALEVVAASGLENLLEIRCHLFQATLQHVAPFVPEYATLVQLLQRELSQVASKALQKEQEQIDERYGTCLWLLSVFFEI